MYIFGYKINIHITNRLNYSTSAEKKRTIIKYYIQYIDKKQTDTVIHHIMRIIKP